MKDRYQPPPSAREGMRYQAPPSAAEHGAPKLTAEDRAALVEQAAYYKREAERLTAELSRLRAEYTDLASNTEKMILAEASLATAVGLLEDFSFRSAEAMCDWLKRRAAFLTSAQPAAPARAESRLATAETENERLRAERDDWYRRWNEVAQLKIALDGEVTALTQQNISNANSFDELSSGYLDRAAAAESRLATAMGLLKLAKDGMYDDLESNIRRFLRGEATQDFDEPGDEYTVGDALGLSRASAQPAAPARTEAEPCEWGPHCPACREERGENARTEAEPNTHSRGCVCVRCEAEQAVFTALERADATALRFYMDSPLDPWVRDVCRAELARRGAK